MTKIVLSIIIGAGIVFGGGYVIGKGAAQAAKVAPTNMVSTSGNNVASLETQNAQLQKETNSLHTQLMQAQSVSASLQQQLASRPTITKTVTVPVPGTVRDADGDGV